MIKLAPALKNMVCSSWFSSCEKSSHPRLNIWSQRLNILCTSLAHFDLNLRFQWVMNVMHKCFLLSLFKFGDGHWWFWILTLFFIVSIQGCTKHYSIVCGCWQMFIHPFSSIWQLLQMVYNNGLVFLDCIDLYNVKLHKEVGLST